MNRRLRLSSATFAAILIGFGLYHVGTRDVTAAPGGEAPGEWMTQQDTGFTIDLPEEWTVAMDDTTGRIEIEGDQGERVTIWPVFTAGALNAASAGHVLRKLAPSVSAATEWDAPEPIGRSAVRMAGRAASDAVVATLAWVPTPQGTAATMYVLSGPAADYRERESTFRKILESFRLAGVGRDAPRQSRIEYQRWRDPRENAFSIEVPSGWRTEGGLFRVAPVDVRAAWRTTSPDGSIQVAGGDAEIPPFIVPTPMLAGMGMGEGSWYSLGYGVRALVRRYTSGADFARQHASRVCANVVIGESRDRPDAVAAVNAINAEFGQMGIDVRMDAGEVEFSCDRAGVATRGYYFAATKLVRQPGGGMWSVEYLLGYLSPPARADEARSVLARMVASFELNPEWATMQQGTAAATSRIVARTNDAISSIIKETYATANRSRDRAMRQGSLARRGVEEVLDPVTGREFTIESGSTYDWINPQGTIVGTNTSARPNMDFRELVRLP